MNAVCADSDLDALHRGGSAELSFVRSPDEKTYIATQRVAYPFHITRPFYLEDDPPGMPTLYFQSVSGGVFASDHLEVSIDVGQRAQAHVTTQASTIVHRMQGQCAVQKTRLCAHQHALLEYMPEPVVLFPDATLLSSVTIICAPDAEVVLYDSFLSHDSKGEAKPFKLFSSELIIQRPDGATIAVDRFKISGAEFAREPTYRAHGSLVFLSQRPDTPELEEQLARVLETQAGCYAGVTSLPQAAGLWMRVLAQDSHALRCALENAWRAIRISLTGKAPRTRPK